MYKYNKILAVIPARGGSKGIARKNIVHIHDKPLIQYTIDAAKDAKYIDKIVVSTDDEEIANISKQCGAEVPFLRPKHLATDTAKTIEVLIHTVEKLNEVGEFYDYLVLLQPTQPIRTSDIIDEAIQTIVDRNEEGLVSISEVSEHPVLIRTMNESGKLQNILNINSTLRRQEFPKYYKVNGSIYINKINDNFTVNTSLNDNNLGFIMDKKYDIDIDEEIDLEFLKVLLENQ
ncbi:cytidylyltransferase domain-containing protein [Lysinibacillus sp. NPDC096418]|uniref:acylneuraminate cytidylyltransferase family protein n=1 Tax=Lysinibacillus sp. NPDC096418 TaxID=3364138 RepID=UPI0038034A6C